MDELLASQGAQRRRGDAEPAVLTAVLSYAGPAADDPQGRNPMMPRLGSMRQFPTVKRTDVQFSNEMSNACPIGHARETDSVVVSEGSQIARVMFSFELSYRWHKRRQFEAQSCRDRLSAGGRVGPFVVRRGADERRAGGYRGRRSGP